MKRIVAFILTLALLISVPVFSFAEELSRPESLPKFVEMLSLRYDYLRLTLSNEDAEILDLYFPISSEFILYDADADGKLWRFSDYQSEMTWVLKAYTQDQENINTPITQLKISFYSDIAKNGNKMLSAATLCTAAIQVMNPSLSTMEAFVEVLDLFKNTAEDNANYCFVYDDTTWELNSTGLILTLTGTVENEADNSSLNSTENVSSTQNALTFGEKNALKAAEQYLEFGAFSYTGLVEQLEYDGYASSEAKYAADNCGADWNEQAAKAAKQYLESSPFSRSGLIEQLMFDGFTQAQAEYGVTQAGY